MHTSLRSIWRQGRNGHVPTLASHLTFQWGNTAKHVWLLPFPQSNWTWRFHRQTVFVDRGNTLLNSENLSRLVFGDPVTCVHREILQRAVCLYRQLSLPFSLNLAIFSDTLPSVLTDSSYRMLESILVLHSLVCSSSLSWRVFVVTAPLLKQSQSAAFHIFRCFMECVVGISCCTEICFDLFHYASSSGDSPWAAWS